MARIADAFPVHGFDDWLLPLSIIAHRRRKGNRNILFFAADRLQPAHHFSRTCAECTKSRHVSWSKCRISRSCQGDRAAVRPAGRGASERGEELFPVDCPVAQARTFPYAWIPSGETVWVELRDGVWYSIVKTLEKWLARCFWPPASRPSPSRRRASIPFSNRKRRCLILIDQAAPNLWNPSGNVRNRPPFLSSSRVQAPATTKQDREGAPP